MNEKMEKVQSMIDAFEHCHGTFSVSEGETLNWGVQPVVRGSVQLDV